MIKDVKNSDEVLDFVLELSQNELTQGYSWKKSAEKIKECIQNAIIADKVNIIACYDEETLCGVCIYHWIPDEKYIQTTQFLIKHNYDVTASEFINYFKSKFDGYEFMIPLPLSNKNVNEYFNKNNAEILEAFINTNLPNFKSYIKEHNNHIEEVTLANFNEYAEFHDKYALPLEMFYDSKNLMKELNGFITLMYKKDNEIIGCIFTKVTKAASEIFGLFKELIYFIEEDCPDELDTALRYGFEIKSRSRTYKINL